MIRRNRVMKSVGVFCEGLKNGEEEVAEEQVLIVREEQRGQR